MPSRITQVVTEVMRQATAPDTRITQLVAEVIRVQTTAQLLRISQVALEVMRSGEPPAQRILPARTNRRVTNNGNGQRIFPV